MGNHRNWCETLFSSSVLSLNLGFELSSAAKSHVCQEKFHINLEIFRDFSEKSSCITQEEWYNSRRNCPTTLRAALKIGLRPLLQKKDPTEVRSNCPLLQLYSLERK